MKTIRLLVLMWAVLCTMQVHAQNDSSLLNMEVLSTQDVVKGPALQPNAVTSASRTPIDIRDLPVTVYVITREEILKNGYLTLVDALKTIPGVRVSQPGSAVEGETFLLRGLFGNYYTKILIDHVPIQPSAVSGMPIGAQFPIQSVERIEVVLGPASAVYGSDAMAGVINIITQKTDKKLVLHADLAFGMLGTTQASIHGAGKLGKGKNVVQYTLGGNFVQRNDLPVKYDRTGNYNPDFYGQLSVSDSLYAQNPNYEGQPAAPVFNDFPHQSRGIHANLFFKGFQLGYQYMYRKDHRAIGINPTAMSVSDPYTFWGEEIHRFHLGQQHQVRKWTFTTNLSYLYYRMDPSSSSRYITPTLFGAIYNAVQNDTVKNGLFETFLSNERYAFQASDDIYAEHIINYQPREWLNVTAGGSFQYSGYLPYIDFLQQPFNMGQYRPFSTELLSDSSFINTYNLYNPATLFVGGGFLQTYMRAGKFRILAGVRYDYHQQYGSSVNPRAGFAFVPTSKWNVELSFGTAFRAPSPYYASGAYRFSNNPLTLIGVENRLRLERVMSGEFRVRYRFTEDQSIELIGFAQKVEEEISRTFYASGDSLFIGYLNDGNSFGFLGGAQLNVKLRNIWKRFRVGVDLNLMYSKGFEQLPNNFGTISQFRNQPEFSGQLAIQATPLKNLYMQVRMYAFTGWLRRFIFDQSQIAALPGYFQQPGYFMMDVSMRYQFNSYFSVFGVCNNITNTAAAGIDASGWTEDLQYNPQHKIMVRIGASFNVN